jgi:hypothetical protein
VVTVIVPRDSRIDAAGAVHDVMSRGIERGTVVRNDADRDQFMKRLGEILQDVKAVWRAYLVRKLEAPKSSLWRKLGISIPSVTKSVTRGRRIAKTNR